MRAALVVLLCLAWVAPAGATSYYVNPYPDGAINAAVPPLGALGYSAWGPGSNSNAGTSPRVPFLSIQHAISVAAAGDTINLACGRYTIAAGARSAGFVYITGPNAPGADITIQTAGFVPPSPTTPPYAVGQPQGCRAVIDSAGYEFGIQFNPASGNYVYDYVIQGIEIDCGARSIDLQEATNNPSAATDPYANAIINSYGIGGNTDHVTVRYDEIHDCGAHGVDFSGSDYVTIEDNLVYDAAMWSPAGGACIKLFQPLDADAVTTYKNYIVNNVTWNCKMLVAETGQGGYIKDGQGIYLDTSSTHSYGGRTLVSGNLAIMGGVSDIGTTRWSHADIVNNTAVGLQTTTAASNENQHGGGAISMYQGDDINVVNNIAYLPDNSTGFNSCAVFAGQAPTNLTTEHNICHGGAGSDFSGPGDETAPLIR